jgi:hypothetical protein
MFIYLFVIGDDIPRLQLAKHTDDGILWKKLTSLQSQNDELQSQLRLANQRLHDVNLKLMNLKNLKQGTD